MKGISRGDQGSQSGHRGLSARPDRRECHDDGADPDRPRFVVVIPIKPPAIGKSRLTGVSAAHRRALAEAFALDTVIACGKASSVGQVLVVTTDNQLSAQLRLLGANTIPDGVPGDLNGTLRHAAATARRRWPDLRPAVVVADMPALRSVELDALLAGIHAPQAFVPDAAGSGTTLYIGTYDNFDPCFGRDSRDAHLSRGAHCIHPAPPSVRRDVDHISDLYAAVSIGVGDHTAALVPSDLPGRFTVNELSAARL